MKILEFDENNQLKKDEINKISAQYGMPAHHIEAILKSSIESDTVIGIRPVNTAAEKHLIKGSPTKSFAIKNKSNVFGLISEDPAYGRDPDTKKEINKYKYNLMNAYKNDEYKNKSNAIQAIPLVLEGDIIVDLVTKKKIKISEEDKKLLTDKNNQKLIPLSWEKTYKDEQNNTVKKTLTVYAQPSFDENNNLVFNIKKEDNTPFNVLGREVTFKDGEKKPLPITADYDLFVVAPNMKNFDPANQDKTPFRTQGYAGSFVHETSRNDQRFSESMPQEDKLGGNWSGRIKSLVNVINTNIAQSDPNRTANSETHTVHHNAEFHNPFADDLQGSIPCLFFFKGKSYLLESVEELKVFRENVRKEGYYFPSHAKYKEEFSPFKLEQLNLANYRNGIISTEEYNQFQDRIDNISPEDSKNYLELYNNINFINKLSSSFAANAANYKAGVASKEEYSAFLNEIIRYKNKDPTSTAENFKKLGHAINLLPKIKSFPDLKQALEAYEREKINSNLKSDFLTQKIVQLLPVTEMRINNENLTKWAKNDVPKTNENVVTEAPKRYNTNPELKINLVPEQKAYNQRIGPIVKVTAFNKRSILKKLEKATNLSNWQVSKDKVNGRLVFTGTHQQKDFVFYANAAGVYTDDLREATQKAMITFMRDFYKNNQMKVHSPQNLVLINELKSLPVEVEAIKPTQPIQQTSMKNH